MPPREDYIRRRYGRTTPNRIIPEPHRHDRARAVKARCGYRYPSTQIPGRLAYCRRTPSNIGTRCNSTVTDNRDSNPQRRRCRTGYCGSMSGQESYQGNANPCEVGSLNSPKTISCFDVNLAHRMLWQVISHAFGPSKSNCKGAFLFSSDSAVAVPVWSEPGVSLESRSHVSALFHSRCGNSANHRACFEDRHSIHWP